MESFSQKNNGEDLRTKNWSDQQAFDPGREIFHLEHIFTGSMFFAKLNEHHEPALFIQIGGNGCVRLKAL